MGTGITSTDFRETNLISVKQEYPPRVPTVDRDGKEGHRGCAESRDTGMEVQVIRYNSPTA